MANPFAFLLSVLILQLVSGGSHTSAEELTIPETLSCGKQRSERSTIRVEYGQRNPAFGTDCVFEIKPYSYSVLQLLIRFGINMMPPTKSANSTNGALECKTDYIEIEGTRYCGYEDDQHIYLPFGWLAGVNLIRIRLVLAPRLGNYSLETYPQFVMMIDQLSFGDNRLAPRGCMQYYVKTKGVISSFNYRNGLGLYPARLNYTICVRHPSDAWAVKLKFSDFNLNGYTTETNSSSLQANEYCSHGGSDDYLSLSQSVVEPVVANDFLNVRPNRFCGRSINNKTVIIEDDSSLDTFFPMHFRSFLPQRSRAGFLIEYEVLYERDANNLYT